MKKTKYLYWLPAVLFASLIFYMSEQQNPPGASLFEFLPNADKLAHMAEYFILSLFVYLALVKVHAFRTPAAAFFSIMIVSIYGASDEFHQNFTPGRTVDFFDWLADLTGALAAQSGIIMHKIIDDLL